ncbi:CDP-diacylglycerol--glycerol-3-phosphate 3-phosphatidyltransferase [Gemmatimonas aurantiaca T-27]|uniref:CDP-diacylglycerol--glycerol-3-phosphate 3-phosphatidyltransferase n=1 Tax=Gemmatimonas aurantiaca (strain DSM 14586 / JCM 11422 / NBRC 100505 / T-27) TaxID=379066 RepID=C1A7E9_GEMAT|nr:CDP-alcohol phosphatidyltransferase family protein [Gemmatimonas aurantiaca]BAH38159.1 CDP-diacylglycerol--glycerol-3-phosphate 3-phosphatidyltransferase [Gemmatimonas aurantiaca T-27]
MNLPNAITVGRIALTPLIAWLPFTTSWTARLMAFVLFLVAAITDYWDGHLARQHNMVTDLGRLLDPLADKLLLVATLVPMYFLQRHPQFIVPDAAFPINSGVSASVDVAPFLFATPFGHVSLPLWIVLVVLGREAFMTLFRQVAARRGLVISAIGPAKWKTTFQSIWLGAAYFWFFALTLAVREGWEQDATWQAFAWFNGFVGVTSMIGAVALTMYSLWLYLRRYGSQVMRLA